MMGAWIKPFGLGVLLGAMIVSAPAYALRIARPVEFHEEWNNNTFSALNDILLQIFNVINGRYQMDVVTVDPDGARKGSKGEMVLFDTGTDQYCVNVNGATSWKCVNIT